MPRENEKLLSLEEKQLFFRQLSYFLLETDANDRWTKELVTGTGDNHNQINLNQMQSKKNTSTSKRQQKQKLLNETEQVLKKLRIALVPFGSDVTKRRLEVWQEIIKKLGGQVQIVLNQAKQHRLKRRKCLDPLDARINWKDFDILIASESLHVKRILELYGEERFPSSLKICTPEWLVFVRREKKIPSDDSYRLSLNEVASEAMFEVKSPSRKPKIVESEEEEKEEEIEKQNAEESDGGDARSYEIERAPEVKIDASKFQKQIEELSKEKEKLVNERIPIFYKNNPNFKGIKDAKETTSLKSETFVCQQTSMMQRNLNAHITDILDDLMEFLHVERDIWREYSYKKVVSSLKAMTRRVSRVSDLKGLWWAKGRMRAKVVEILETGRLEKLEAKKANPRLRTLVEFSRIWGVGPVTAAKFYNMGYKSLDDLRTRGQSVLTDQQKIGLKRYKDFLTKIPRAEVQKIEEIVVNEIHRLLPSATALATGSYRRGKAQCGDCDILVTDPDEEECGILKELLENLHRLGFLTDDLTHVYGHKMGRCDSYMGVCQVDKSLPHRRLDIKVYPRRFFGFALLYFTGSDHFNRSMRLFARKNGWSLSDRSLKRVIRNKATGVTVEQGESVVCYHEVDVFIALGLEYKDPIERNCFDIRFLEEDEQQAKHRSKKAVTSTDIESVQSNMELPRLSE